MSTLNDSWGNCSLTSFAEPKVEPADTEYLFRLEARLARLQNRQQARDSDRDSLKVLIGEIHQLNARVASSEETNSPATIRQSAANYSESAGLLSEESPRADLLEQFGAQEHPHHEVSATGRDEQVRPLSGCCQSLWTCMMSLFCRCCGF
jgi:hypothetical protein